jgi:protein ImuB
VLHCPQWPIVTAGAQVDEPVAVIHANRVVARSIAAAAGGVRLGQRRREAQARCPQVRLVAHEPTADRRAFVAVAEAVSALVPRLELGAAGTLTFATRGPSRYFGGDAAIAARVLAVADEVLGDRARAAGAPGLGIADGRFVAGVAAHRAIRVASRTLVVEAGESPAFVAPLSLRWLVDVGEIDVDQVQLFGRLGLRCLGDLAALPQPDVLARFGWTGVAARSMAAGLDDRPLGTEDPPAGLAVIQHFESPVQHLDAVVFAGRQLAEQLISALGSHGRVCTQFVAIAETDHGERSERVWSLSSGFSIAAVVERIRWQLDGWAHADDSMSDPTSGPTSGITSLHIEPTEVRPDDGIQLGLWGGRTQADEWAQRAAARLIGLVGDQQVLVAEWCGGRRPDESYRLAPASLSSRLDPGARAEAKPPPQQQLSVPWPGSLPAPSPATVHSIARPIGVLDVDGQPVAVSGRGVISAAPAALLFDHGQLDRERVGVSAWAGPWPIDERWWDAARHRRMARVQVVVNDGRAFLIALEHRQWWLLAEYS